VPIKRRTCRRSDPGEPMHIGFHQRQAASRGLETAFRAGTACHHLPNGGACASPDGLRLYVIDRRPALLQRRTLRSRSRNRRGAWDDPSALAKTDDPPSRRHAAERLSLAKPPARHPSTGSPARSGAGSPARRATSRPRRSGAASARPGSIAGAGRFASVTGCP
jgi:hypothetical protein